MGNILEANTTKPTFYHINTVPRNGQNTKHFHFTIFRYPRVYPFQKIWCLAWAIFFVFCRLGEP